MVKFAALLKAARLAKGYRRQIDLARELGCTDTFISQMESGRAWPSERRMYDLSKLFGWDPTDIRRVIAFEKADEELREKMTTPNDVRPIEEVRVSLADGLREVGQLTETEVKILVERITKGFDIIKKFRE